MKKICVFCSSHPDLRKEYVEAADSLGTEIARHGCKLVYGGSKCGLMKVVANAVHAAGGKTEAVVPEILITRGLADDADDMVYCAGLDDRKSDMLRNSDVFVALPGGIGTLDEIFTVVAANVIGYHSKKVVLYNVEGFWTPLVRMIRHMEDERMVNPDISEKILVASTAEELYSIVFQDSSSSERQKSR